MRVVHVSTYDITGGAARAAYRVHTELLNQEVDSQMLVMHKRSIDPTVHVVRHSQYYRLVQQTDHFASKFFFPQQSHHSLNILPTTVVNDINALQPDIVHLHWVGYGLVPPAAVAQIQAPIVWTLHDMWPFCGAEHYTTQERFMDGYASQKYSSSRIFDINRWVWQRKQRAWQGNLNFQIVAPSTAFAEYAKHSSAFQNQSIHIIANGLDTHVFAPQDTQSVRTKLQLPQNKKIILFGAVNADDDSRKGADLLKEALRHFQKLIKDTHHYEIVTFGKIEKDWLHDLPFSHRAFGKVDDDVELAQMYSAADVMVVPSRQESFGQTASEAMACGTPVVCFDTTGLKDIIDHMETGYRAHSFDATDLAIGIQWVVSDVSRHTILSSNSRKQALEKFNIYRQTHQYSKLYTTMIG